MRKLQTKAVDKRVEPRFRQLLERPSVNEPTGPDLGNNRLPSGGGELVQIEGNIVAKDGDRIVPLTMEHLKSSLSDNARRYFNSKIFIRRNSGLV